MDASVRSETASRQSTARTITHTFSGMATSDGAGVRLNRLIGRPGLADLDPFLLLDEFRSDDAGDYIAGFPAHPHRGFETVTYMLAGRMRHQDNKGNVGLLRPGSVQWMTAGRGIVHSEMPEQENGLMWGFQLWVNLPASDKMTAPRYQDIDPEAIPVVTRADGTSIKVIAGTVDGTEGAVSAIVTQPTYLDVTLPAGKAFTYAVPDGHTAFVYVYEGSAQVGADGQELKVGELGVLGAGDEVALRAGDADTRLLLVAAQPLNEPIARRGPFVMNTALEISQAIADFQAGRF